MSPDRPTLRGIAPSVLARLIAVFAAMAITPSIVDSQEVGRTVIPVGSQWPGAHPAQIDLSDNGRFVVYQANRGDGSKLFLHQMGQSVSREVEGLGDTPYYGTVSPDGQWLLFGKKARIWKTPLSGGELTLVYPVNNSKTWETNQTLLVTKGTGGIWRVQADGSLRDEQVAPVDTATGATYYGRPSLLPGGKGVLVSVGFGTGTDLQKIGVVSIPGGKLTILDEYGVHPHYAESGHILYSQGNTLKAIPFDVDRLEVRGPGASVVESVRVYSNQTSQFDISRNGVLVYVSGSSELNRIWPSSLVWVDRQGNESPFDTPAEKVFNAVRLSPNGRFLAAQVGSGLHLFDRQTGTWRVLLEDGDNGVHFWSQDSESLFVNRSGVFGRVSVDGGEPWEELVAGFAPFSSDGIRAFGTQWNPDRSMWSLVSTALEGAANAEPLLESTNLSRRNPGISPDGKWLAYVEKVGGLDNVYVQPYPAGGRALLVSKGASGEAAEVMWGRSSQELFYRDAVHMVSVQLETTPSLMVKGRTPLFPIRSYNRYLNTYAALYDYNPTTDRFLTARGTIADPPPGRTSSNGERVRSY